VRWLETLSYNRTYSLFNLNWIAMQCNWWYFSSMTCATIHLNQMVLLLISGNYIAKMHSQIKSAQFQFQPSPLN